MATVPGIVDVYKQPLVEAQQMTFWWNPPTSDGGTSITSYVLCNASPALNYTYDGNQRSAFVTGLTTNVRYSFQIAASNSVGLGSYTPFNIATTGLRPIANQSISVIPTKTTSNALVTWTSNTSNASYNLLGNVLAARAFDISGVEQVASNVKPSFGPFATSGFLQNLGPFTYRVFAQPANSVGYARQQVSTIIDNIPGSAIFQTYGTSSNSILQFGIQDTSFSATTPFTLEWWQYMTDLPSGSAPRAFSITTNPTNILDDSFNVAFVSTTGAVSSNVNYRISYRSTDSPVITTIETSSAVAQSNIVNTWQHIALVGTVSNGPPLVTRMRLYVGGQYIFQTSSNYNLGTLLQMQLGAPTGGLFNNTLFGFNGAITSFRFTKDAALYSGASLARPTPPLFNAPSGSTQITLPFWFSNDFVDRSSNSNPVNNFLSTVNWLKNFPGYPDASGSIVFSPVSQAQYLEPSFTGTPAVISTQPFTIEFYAYVSSITLGTQQRFFSMSTQAGGPLNPEEHLAWYLSNSSPTTTTHYIKTKNSTDAVVNRAGQSIGLIENGWHHFAMVGSNTGGQSNYINTYVDGAFVNQFITGNNTNIYNYTNSISKFYIGHAVDQASNAINYSFRGKITNFRFITNTAQYLPTSFAFTPPTIPLPSTPTTQVLLTCPSIFTYAKNTMSRSITNYGTNFSQSMPGGYVVYSTIDGGLTTSTLTNYTASNILVTSTATLSLVQMEMFVSSATTIATNVYRVSSGNTTNIPTNNITAATPTGLRFWTGSMTGPLSLVSGDTIALTHSNIAGVPYQTGAASLGPPSVIPTVRFITIKPELNP
jgi:hypothetical protein